MRRSILRSAPSRRTRLAAVLATGATVAAVTAGTAAASSGSDISAWQHPQSAPINWTNVRAAGNDFVFIKASEGTGYTNPWYDGDVAGSHAAGMLHGAYDFASPGTAGGAAEARHFASVVGSQNRPGCLPPVLDLEVTGGLRPSRLIRWVAAWLRTTKARTHRTPMIYVSPSFWYSNMRNTHRFTGYPLWVADWGVSHPMLFGGWNHWTFWQFTSSARVAGIRGRVDEDQYAGTPAALRRLGKLGSGSGAKSGSHSGSNSGTGGGSGPAASHGTASVRQDTVLRLKLPRRTTGHPVNIRGGLSRRHGGGVATVRVALQRKWHHGRWHTFDSLTTSSHGTFRHAYRLGSSVRVRGVFQGSSQLQRAVSSVKAITVRHRHHHHRRHHRHHHRHHRR